MELSVSCHIQWKAERYKVIRKLKNELLLCYTRNKTKQNKHNCMIQNAWRNELYSMLLYLSKPYQYMAVNYHEELILYCQNELLVDKPFSVSNAWIIMVNQKFGNILVHASLWHIYYKTKSWKVSVIVGSIMVVSAWHIVHCFCMISKLYRWMCNIVYIWELILPRVRTGAIMLQKQTKIFVMWKMKVQLITVQ